MQMADCDLRRPYPGGKKILMWLEESREPTEHI